MELQSKLTRSYLVALLFAVMVAPALPQSLPNLPITRLGYTVRKRTVNPQGDMKNRIDALDRQLAEATRLGNIGEVRRLLAKGMVLLAGNEWTDALDYEHSIALRADRAFVDTSHPYTVRIEQIYTPTLALERSLSARVSVRKAPAGRGGGQPEVVKDLGAFDDVSRDLRESPYLMELDLSSVPDGTYQVHVEVMDGEKSLGSASLRFAARRDLDSALARLESEAKSAPEPVRADVLYPIDYVHNVNRGRYDIGAFDINKEIANAQETLAAAKSGKPAFAGRTGDFKRHYFLTEAGEIMPYRLYIPKNYDGSRAFPLVVALHGLGGTEDSMFGANYQVIPEAEKRGYIIAAPLGYRIDGGYGRNMGADNKRSKFSEQDVMHVLELVRKDYKIDEQRIYLMGHSMGGIGTWTLGAKYPQIWASLAPISGVADPRTVEIMRHIPEVVVHGDADNTVPVTGSRAMVEEMRKLGVDVKYIEVPGGSHTSVPGPNMSAIFDFFDTHKKSAESGGR
jgi:predicted esterase